MTESLFRLRLKSIYIQYHIATRKLKIKTIAHYGENVLPVKMIMIIVKMSVYIVIVKKEVMIYKKLLLFIE